MTIITEGPALNGTFRIDPDPPINGLSSGELRDADYSRSKSMSRSGWQTPTRCSRLDRRRRTEHTAHLKLCPSMVQAAGERPLLLEPIHPPCSGQVHRASMAQLASRAAAPGLRPLPCPIDSPFPPAMHHRCAPRGCALLTTRAGGGDRALGRAPLASMRRWAVQRLRIS